MSASLGEAVLHLLGDDSKLVNTTNTAKSKAESILGKVGTGMKAVGVGLAATAGVVTSVAAALGTTIGPASDLSETVSKVGVVFGDSASKVLAFGDNAAQSLGMSKNAALSAAGTYGNLFRALGLTEAKSADMSTSLIGLAGDLASFNNMDPTTVLDSLRAGITGETEPLKKLGININETILKQKAMELGLYNGTGALDAAAKAQASYALIMEQTSLAQGDFARTSDGVANQQRILAATLENIKASIGTGLLPIIQKVLGGLSGYVGQLGSLISDSTLTTEEKVAKGGEIVANLANDISTNLPVMMESATGILRAIITGIISALPTLLPAVIEMLMSLLNFLIEMLPILIDGALQIVLALALGIAAALPTLIPTIVQMLIAILQVLIENLPMLIDAGLQIVLGLVMGIIDAIPILIENIPQLIGSLVLAIIQALPMIINAAIEIIYALVKGLIGAIPKLVKAVPEIIDAIINAFAKGLPSFQNIGGDLMESFLTGLKSKFEMIWQTVVDFVNRVIAKIREALDMHSPSPLLIAIGAQIPADIGTGIENKLNSLAGISSRIGGEIVLNTRSSLKDLNKVNSFNIDQQENESNGVNTSITKDGRVYQLLFESYNEAEMIRYLRKTEMLYGS